MTIYQASAIFRRTDLSRAERYVYFALATFTNKQNTCFPAHKTIAERAAYSVATVKRALNRLRELGLVTWYHCFARDRARLKNRYAVSEPDTRTQGREKPKAVAPTPTLIIGRHDPEYDKSIYQNTKTAIQKVQAAANAAMSRLLLPFGGFGDVAMEF